VDGLILMEPNFLLSNSQRGIAYDFERFPDSGVFHFKNQWI
jgi:hypothetical protein